MNILNSLAFQENLDKKTLTNLLETLDHIDIKWISREDYSAKNGDILQDREEAKEYSLYLPEDLKIGELIYIIHKIVLKFGLEEFGAFDKLVSYTKAFVGTLLKDGEITEKDLNELIKLYNIPEDFVARILQKNKGSIKMSARNLIKETREGREKGEEAFSEILSQEFDLTFFRKGVNDIRFCLETTTEEEKEEFIQKLVSEGYEETEHLEFRKGDNVVYISGEKFDKYPRLLRDKIGIDKLKRDLEEVRATGNNEKIATEELKILRKIEKLIDSSFNYHGDGDENGFQIKKILEIKQVQCVGISIILHSILSELGINHNGVSEVGHSSLDVIIGGERYSMNSSNVYRTYGDVEKILISQIYNNKGVMLLGLGEDEEAIKMYNRAMILNPRDLSSYMNKGISLNILGKVKLGKLYEFTVLLMRGGDKFIWFFELKKLKIKAFIEAKDYDGLANYLIDLERKTD